MLWQTLHKVSLGPCLGKEQPRSTQQSSLILNIQNINKSDIAYYIMLD